MIGKGENLRRGWTTGACATAAAKAAAIALGGGDFPDPVDITLPGGQTAAFALADHWRDGDRAMAAVVKDAGDDPDVTQGAVIVVVVRRLAAGQGVIFRAGAGVGTVTLPGLPVAPGEAAINPVPRQMIRAALGEAAALTGGGVDFEVEISVPGGDALAARTLNPRLGIVGGISILGTTGVVIPYSCAAWIHSIHRGIDVARAAGHSHVIGATGASSEAAARTFHGLEDRQMIDMGDFIGGMLKYLRAHPVPRVTVAGGVAKMTKLAQGMLDVHSKRGRADMAALAELAGEIGAAATLRRRLAAAPSVAGAFDIARAGGLDLGGAIAERAWTVAAPVLAGSDSALEILVFDRAGALRGQAPLRPVHGASPRKRRG